METSGDKVFSVSRKLSDLPVPEITPDLHTVKHNPETTDDGVSYKVEQFTPEEGASDKEEQITPKEDGYGDQFTPKEGGSGEQFTPKEGGSGEQFTPKEGGYGWLVCLTAMWASGTTFGVINIFGIMYVVLRDKYKHTETDISFKTSLIGSLAIGVTLLMSLPASIAIDKLGLRKTAFLGSVLSILGLVSSAFVENISLYYLTFATFFGIGASFTYNPSIFILGHYFKRRLGLVNGLVTFGSPLFSVAISLFLPPLLKNIGLCWTFLTLAGMWCVTLLCTLTWKPQYESDVGVSKTVKKSGCQLTSNTKYINFEIWKNSKYAVWVISITFFGIGYFTPFVHMSKHSEDKFPGYDSSLMVLCINIGTGVGRLLSGKISDWLSQHIIILHQCAMGLYGLLTILVPVVNNYYGLIVVTLALGLTDGMYICLHGPIVFHILGPNRAAQGIGFLYTTISIPLTVGPALTGLMYDDFGSYQIAFHVVGCSGIVAFLILFFIIKKPSWKQNKTYDLQ